MTRESLTQSVDDDQVHVIQISAIDGHEASGLAGLGSNLELNACVNIHMHTVACSRTSMYIYLLETRVSVHEQESLASV